MIAVLALVVQTWAAEPFFTAEAVADQPLHLRLDTAASWGIGGQMFLGAQVHLAGQVGVWNTGRGTGSFDFGLQANYGNEATFLAPWIDRETTTGATHRVQLVATVGHTAHVGPQRRFSVGVQWFVGWNHWRSQYAVDLAEAGVQEKAVVQRDLLTTGGQVTLGYRISRHVGVNLFMAAPLPTPSSYAVGLASLGLGPTFYLK